MPELYETRWGPELALVEEMTVKIHGFDWGGHKYRFSEPVSIHVYQRKPRFFVAEVLGFPDVTGCDFAGYGDTDDAAIDTLREVLAEVCDTELVPVREIPCLPALKALMTRVDNDANEATA